MLYLLLLVMLWAAPSQAATFWESTFDAEDCNWVGTVGPGCLQVNSGVMQIDTASGVKYAGAGSLKYFFDWPQVGSCTSPWLRGEAQCGGYSDRAIPPSSRLWRRFWLRLSTDFYTEPPGTKIVKIGSDGNSDWLGFGPNGNNVWQLVMSDQTTPRQLWVNASLTRGQWHCIEMDQQVNTPGVANGTFVLYFDGTLAANYSDVQWRAANDSSLMNYTRVIRQNGQGTMWMDNYAVGDTRIGCGAAPPPTNPTPPGQVTGLTSPSKTDTSISYAWTARTESDLGSYVLEGCAGGGCTPATIATVGASVTNYAWTGRTASTLYRFRVAARNTSGGTGTFSSIVDVTTNAATTLPTVTNFTTTATGGQITYTGTPTDFRIAFGGTNGDGSFWNSQIIRTLAQVPGGALSFNWPLGTSWACAHARDAVAAEDAVGYRCNSVTPAPPGGSTSSTFLRKLSSNPRWLTLDGTTAIYRVGISGGDNCNASFCGLQDQVSSNTGYGYVPVNLITSTTITDTFDGTAGDIGTLWDAGYTDRVAFTKVSGVAQSVGGATAVESRAEYIYGNQFAKATLQTFGGTGLKYLRTAVNMSAPPTLNGYACYAMKDVPGGYTSAIDRMDAGTGTWLVNESATTWTTGDTLECKRVGKFIYLLRNGSVLLTAEDATYRDGRVGMVTYADTPANATVTNFTGGPVVADFAAALDTLVTEGSNWVRYWTMEQSRYGTSAVISAGDEISIPYDQFPYQWTGTTRTDTSTGVSLAVPVYDLLSPNQAFYDRVVARVDAALARGITPIITMFSGGHLAYPGMVSGFSNPFYGGNNTNGVSCDANGNGQCEEAHTLSNGNINNAQRQYVDRLVQALGNRPVILEVTNEDQTDSTLWQNMIMERVRTAEATYSTNAHVIFQSGWFHGTNYPAGGASNAHLFSNHRNDAISPLCTSDGVNYETNPPASDGTKLVFYDNDHTGWNGVCAGWTKIVPWKLFTRAIYPIYLSEWESAPVQVEIKAAMAQTLSYANRMDLAKTYPETGTTYFSTGYGLFTGTNSTTPNCSEYLLLMPSDGSSTINLTSCSGGATFDVEYLNLTSGAVTSGGTTTGGASRAFNPAGSDPMVVYLKLNSVTDTTPPVISCQMSPLGVLPAGTTSVDILCTSNETATLKYDTSPDVAYASQATTFGTTGTMSHSTTVGSLADGTSYTRYVRATDGTNPTTTDYPVSWSVAAAPVTVIPANVTNVRGTLDEAAGTILWQWDAAANADRYLIEISIGGTFLVAVESAAAATFYVQGSITAANTYNARVKGIATSNTHSVNWGSSTPVATTLPPALTGLADATPGAYTNTITLTWTAPSNSSLIAVFDRCAGAGCSSWAFLGGISAVALTDNTVSAGTTYCYRGKFTNPVFGGTSTDWSAAVCATTKTAVVGSGSLTRPRTPLPFGQPRAPRN